jgi:Fe-S cluster assembly iron-binding protein IscA
MIEITPLAHEKLTSFLTENHATPQVRVFLPLGGCGGDNQLSLTVDGPNENDFFVKNGPLTISIDKKLQLLTGSVTIDFQEEGGDSGFIVATEKILPPADADCGGCCDCC